MYSPERLHAVRIAAKKLRYGLELAADSGSQGRGAAGAHDEARPGRAREAARPAGAADAHRRRADRRRLGAARAAGGARGPRRQVEARVPPSAREVPAVVGRRFATSRRRPQGHRPPAGAAAAPHTLGEDGSAEVAGAGVPGRTVSRTKGTALAARRSRRPVNRWRRSSCTSFDMGSRRIAGTNSRTIRSGR